MSAPVCPFCERDPFHYVDNGIGMEAVAVDCCELGNLYFRGARAAPEEIDLSWEEFSEIGQRLLSTSTALREMREALMESVNVLLPMARAWVDHVEAPNDRKEVERIAGLLCAACADEIADDEEEQGLRPSSDGAHP